MPLFREPEIEAHAPDFRYTISSRYGSSTRSRFSVSGQSSLTRIVSKSRNVWLRRELSASGMYLVALKQGITTLTIGDCRFIDNRRSEAEAGGYGIAVEHFHGIERIFSQILSEQL